MCVTLAKNRRMQVLPSNLLLGLTVEELRALVLKSGQPAYRAQQLFEAVYRQPLATIDEISTLPHEYRAQLKEEGWQIGLPAISRKFVSSDGTIRYLMELADDESV